MAWMLVWVLENLDVTAAALSAAKAGGGALGGLILKRVWGKMVNSEKCMVPKCSRVQYSYGLCLRCYDRACEMVHKGETTWEKLAAQKLCKMQSDPFNDAYSEAMRDH